MPGSKRRQREEKFESTRNGNAAQHFVATARQHGEAGARLAVAFGLVQDPPADGHDAVGCENQCRRMARRHRLELGGSHAQGVGARQLARKRRLVDVGGIGRSRLDPDLPQQIQAAR